MEKSLVFVKKWSDLCPTLNTLEIYHEAGMKYRENSTKGIVLLSETVSD